MYILTTELRSGHMVEEGCCSADFRINHSSWWNTDQGSVVIGNLIQMLLGNEPRCGRKWTSTKTINSILLSQQSLPKHREILHLGKWKVNLLCFLCTLSSEYHVDDPPRLVLDKLEKIGFRVLTMTGVGQTLVWCLHKETEWSKCWLYQNTWGKKKLAMYVSAKHRCVRVYVSQFFFSMLNFQFYVLKTRWWSASVWTQKPLG